MDGTWWDYRHRLAQGFTNGWKPRHQCKIVQVQNIAKRMKSPSKYTKYVIVIYCQIMSEHVKQYMTIQRNGLHKLTRERLRHPSETLSNNRGKHVKCIRYPSLSLAGDMGIMMYYVTFFDFSWQPWWILLMQQQQQAQFKHHLLLS